MTTMNLFKYHSKPEELAGHREAHDTVPDLIASEITKGKEMNAKQMKIIQTSADLSYNYAANVVEGRWPPGEKAIIEAKNPNYPVWYARTIIKGRWPEFEQRMISNDKSALAIPDYIETVVGGKGKWPEGEASLINKPIAAVYFAARILQDRFPAAEPAIAKNAQTAYNYAVYVLSDRFPEGEDAIKTDSKLWGNYKEKYLGDES